MSLLRVGLFVNKEKRGAFELLLELVEYFNKEKIAFLLEDSTARLIGQRGISISRFSEEVDLILVAGGDGTIIRIAHEIFPSPVPILGVNTGSLGFLTAVSREEILPQLPNILQGRFRKSPRMVLRAVGSAYGNNFEIPCSLNDIVLFRGAFSHMATIDVFAQGNLVTEFQSDGLVVSTPTGSTAYALSTGGPIIMPESEVFTLNPICPHTLTNRSLVFPEEVTLRFSIPLGGGPVRLEYDGIAYGDLHPGDWLEIEASPKKVILGFLEERNFFEILRRKLRWSGATVEE
ncbi:NAD+ kinase [Methylacidiphilum sp. Yel]|uniref:NAD(+)/NADH kinase n=1 Tax=Methylacidiphilum sp. Yel TaxID=1847730 RepID=UPI00106A7E1A|nr:NAD(+)/NADH kinase [Methylacidiphilum sp. Yel]TFE66250.1 NAD+ kinase [Methylacidiphilum sp. Yel]